MKKFPPPSGAVFPWLRANLGPRALAPLTGTDTRALRAAVEIIALYSQIGLGGAPLGAFRDVVMCMQPSTRHLAYHSVAMVMDWEDRQIVWGLAGLPELGTVAKCNFEPGGSERRAAL